MARPTKPELNIPAEFAPNGVKNDFVADKLINGFDNVDPDVLAGDNLNKLVDDFYKSANYTMDSVEDLYDVCLKKEIHIYPEVELQNSDGYYYWIINHQFGHSNIMARLLDIETGAVLWGEPSQITNTQVIYKSKYPRGNRQIKAVLIG